jgi:L-asparaginase II
MSHGENYEPVFELSRAGHLESLHWGSIAVVDNQGNLVASLGDVDFPIFPRSSVKPFQAMPLILSGVEKKYQLNQSEIALICASHAGTNAHITAAESILAKIGLSEADLLCGSHAPYDQESATELIKAGRLSGILHHNCSGKHCGMLASAKQNGWDTGTYTAVDHPVQMAAKQTFAQWAGMNADDLIVGIDGCSAANFAAPLHNTARAYAALMDPRQMKQEQIQAADIIRSAMLAFPEMVGGPQQFDTQLMQATNIDLISKTGAEGFQAIGIPANALGKGSPALGVALKIADGDGRNWASSAVSLEILDQLGLFSQAEKKSLDQFGPVRKLRNQAGLVIGRAQPVFELNSKL